MPPDDIRPIPPTLNLERAAFRPWDVIVIGAGPAGATVAREAARSGLSTLLVERQSLPRAKPCGGCLNHHVVSLLRGIGLGDALDECGGQPVTSVQLHHAGHRARIPLPAGVAVSRETFDAMLVRSAIEAGAQFLPETTGRVAVLDEPGAASRRVELMGRAAPDATARAHVVVVADGLARSSVLVTGEFEDRVDPHSRIGVAGIAPGRGTPLPAGTITMAIGQAGYAGAVLVEGDRINIAAALDPVAVRAAGSPARTVAAVMEAAGAPMVAGLDDVEWIGTIPLTRRVVRPAAWRILLVGDAAGYEEPFTGQGMEWAIASALSAGPLVRRGVAGWTTDIELDWLAVRQAVVGRGQRSCRRLARALRSALAVQFGMAMLGVWPSLAGPFVSRFDGGVAAAGGGS